MIRKEPTMSLPQDDVMHSEPRDEASSSTRRSLFAPLDGLQPIADLWLRLVVAWAFYKSGVGKTTSEGLFDLFGLNLRYPTSLEPTSTTLFLFRHEYNVPILSPELAAQLGTAAEIILPVLLAFGLFGRLVALGLFGFNIVAVLSYPVAQTGAAFYLHLLWGSMLLITLAHGPGKLSIDHLVGRLSGRG